MFTLVKSYFDVSIDIEVLIVNCKDGECVHTNINLFFDNGCSFLDPDFYI